MSRLDVQTVETATRDVAERLAAVKKSTGFVPNLLGVLGNAPTAIEAYQTVSSINARNSLTPTEREVVQITAAVRNGCNFCTAGHTKIAQKKLRLPQALIDGLRHTQALEDVKLNALAVFTLAMIEERGKVSDEQLQSFQDAGYSSENVLDVVLGVSLASLCNYANNVAQTVINPELQEFALN